MTNFSTSYTQCPVSVGGQITRDGSGLQSLLPVSYGTEHKEKLEMKHIMAVSMQVIYVVVLKFLFWLNKFQTSLICIFLSFDYVDESHTQRKSKIKLV